MRVCRLQRAAERGAGGALEPPEFLYPLAFEDFAHVQVAVGVGPYSVGCLKQAGLVGREPAPPALHFAAEISY